MGLALLVGLAAAGGSSLAAERGAARVPAEARRVALVIGNSDYVHAARLENPVNDAHLIAETLRSLGFELVGGKEMLDLDKAGMDKAVQAFGRDLGPGSVALFYYAGHGNELGGNNFLLPVDANPFKPSDYDFQTLNAVAVLRQMQDAGTRLNIVILDACRDNPFGGRGMRAAAAGLASMEPPEGTLIAYAAGVGKKAQDGPPGGNSPYTGKLAKAMAHQGWTLWETFNEVGLEVKAYTGGVQTPWISNEPIKGEFCFAGCEAGESEAERQLREARAEIERLRAERVAGPVGELPRRPPLPTLTPPSPTAPTVDPADRQAAYQGAFNSLKNGEYPEAIRRFKSFIATYPSGEYTDSAYYWLAEAYYVNRDFLTARDNFYVVVQEFPSSAKVADAYLKLGFIGYEIGQYDTARNTLNYVITHYSGSSAAKLAERRLERMRQERL